MDLILHIGREKTGTTALQAFLRKDIKRISNGYYYFPTDITMWNSNRAFTALFDNSLNYHFYRGLKIKNWDQHNILSKRIEDDIVNQIHESKRQNYKCWIISTENLSTNVFTTDQVLSLKNFIDQHFNLKKIVCYVKDQYSDAISRYAQRIRKGENLVFDEYASSLTPNNPLFSHNSYFNIWNSFFEKDKICVENYVSENGSSKNIIHDFMTRHLHLDEKLVKAEGYRLNSKFNYVATECFSHVNKKFPRWSDTNYTKIRETLLQQLLKIDAGKLEIMFFPYREQLLERFKKDNLALANEYLKEPTLYSLNVKAELYDEKERKRLQKIVRNVIRKIDAL